MPPKRFVVMYGGGLQGRFETYDLAEQYARNYARNTPGYDVMVCELKPLFEVTGEQHTTLKETRF